MWFCNKQSNSWCRCLTGNPEHQRPTLWQLSLSPGAGEREAMAGSSPLPKGLMPLGHRTTPWLHRDMGPGPLWPTQGALGQECGPMPGDVLGVGVIPIALPIWDPLALPTSHHLVLCPCRLTGARSYRCHCHRLPPGYVCACGLGRHHAEKVLGLLNSIKDFSVTQPVSCPQLLLLSICLGPPREKCRCGCGKGHSRLFAGQQSCTPKALLACGSPGCMHTRQAQLQQALLPPPSGGTCGSE